MQLNLSIVVASCVDIYDPLIYSYMDSYKYLLVKPIQCECLTDYSITFKHSVVLLFL